jgi:UDP-glucose 4-epimerase
MSGSEIRSQRVLVVGWGFIGAAVGHRLLSSGTSVAAFTRSETARTERARREGVDVCVGDTDSREALEEALLGASHVLYAAGGLLPPSAAAAPFDDAAATLSPLIHTLQALAGRPEITLTYVSSGGTVYGNPSRTPVRETDPLRPISPYGASRLAGEIYVQTYSRTAGIAARVVRCANVYGPGQPADRGQGAVAVFLERVSSGLPVEIVGDGSAVRDYVYIDDVATALAHLVAVPADVDVVNMGSGVGHSVMQLLDKVSAVVGRPTVAEFRPARRHDVASIVLDITRLQTLISYTPVSLVEGLRRTWEAHETREVTASLSRR